MKDRSLLPEDILVIMEEKEEYYLLQKIQNYIWVVT